MDTGIERMNVLVNEIVGFVLGPAQDMEIGEVERGLLKLVMRVGREGLVCYLEEKGTGRQGNEIVAASGERLPYVRDRKCLYRSIFGPIEIKRAYYHATGSPGVFPLDSEINLPEKGYSYLLEEISSKLAVNGSYEKACEVVGDIFPLNLPIRSLERIVGDVREDVVRYYDQKPTPESSEQAVITVATIDRKGVVIRKPPSEEAAAKAAPSDPDKPGKKKMSTVTSAYNIKRHRRTAYQVGREINEEEPLPDKPKPEAKEVWGSVIETVEQGIFRLKQAVDKRLKATQELVCILDGERGLWRLVYKYFPTAFFVLDIFHVLEHLAEAAHCFYEEKTPEARKFVTERLKMLLTGQVGRLIGGLKQIVSKRKLSKGQKYRLNKVIGYLERNKKHMRYDVCLEKGYPIGSGVIEGACRNLINDRLELTGMRWILQGAESVIRLRAVFINKDWADFWSFRRRSERERLYGTSKAGGAELYGQELPQAA
ncbi:MAG: ISKra4 family transposase [Desulfomonilaceae bacterium]